MKLKIENIKRLINQPVKKGIFVKYIKELENIQEEHLKGFFVDWPNPPSQETHLKMLKQSYRVWLAIDEDTNQVVGFINAVSDGVLSAYIPLLEVLPEYKSKGIGSELVKKMMESLNDLYMVDLCCDEDVVPFYKKFDMFHGHSMLHRNYECQSGKV